MDPVNRLNEHRCELEQGRSLPVVQSGRYPTSSLEWPKHRVILR